MPNGAQVSRLPALRFLHELRGWKADGKIFNNLRVNLRTIEGVFIRECFIAAWAETPFAAPGSAPNQFSTTYKEIYTI